MMDRRAPWLALALVGVIATACAGTAVPSSGPIATGITLAGSPPATGVTLPAVVEGLPVLSVEAAIGAHDAGAFPDDSLLAVGGWLEATLPPGCPYDPSNPNPAALEEVCGWIDHVLARDPQALATTVTAGDASETTGRNPSGPYLVPRQGEGAIINEAEFDHPGSGDGYAPRAAIILGHFHDPRAALCPAAKRATCDGEFVADQVAWLDGTPLGPSFWIGGDASGYLLHPRLDEGGVLAAAERLTPSGSTVVWMSALRAADLAVLDPRQHISGAPDAVVWFVRYTVPLAASAGTEGPNGTGNPSPAGSSGWLIVADLTGAVLAQGR